MIDDDFSPEGIYVAGGYRPSRSGDGASPWPEIPAHYLSGDPMARIASAFERIASAVERLAEQTKETTK